MRVVEAEIAGANAKQTKASTEPGFRDGFASTLNLGPGTVRESEQAGGKVTRQEAIGN